MKGYIITLSLKTSLLVVLEARLRKGGSGNLAGEVIGLNGRKAW